MVINHLLTGMILQVVLMVQVYPKANHLKDVCMKPYWDELPTSSG